MLQVVLVTCDSIGFATRKRKEGLAVLMESFGNKNCPQFLMENICFCTDDTNISFIVFAVSFA